MKRLASGLLGLLILTLVSTSLLFTVSGSESFPIGLVLEYQVIWDGASEWTEQYAVDRWAPEHGETVVVINFSSTNPVLPNTTIYADIISWQTYYANGSFTRLHLQPPLWIDASTWHLGETVQVPTYSTAYFLSTEDVRLLLGTYTCWRARSIAWLSMDDDFQQIDENWFFHQTSGILIKHSVTMLTSQHVIYTYTFTRTLLSSNLSQYGIFSDEENLQFALQKLGSLLMITIVPLTIGSFLLYRERRSRT